MSRSEATERSQRWLEEQLELLGGLRNATSRDPIFKLWRQNTLTVLQRIWPNETARSERFRRIAFSPTGSRPEPKRIREMYSAGCLEASNYLRQLIADVEAHGVVESKAPVERDPSLPHGEDDFPTVELPSGDVRAARGPDAGDNDIVLDLGGPSVESPLAPEPRAEDSGVPPTLKVDIKAAVPPASPPAAQPASRAPSDHRGRTGRSGRPQKRANMKQRLKDMLGLSHLSAPSPEETAAAAPIEEARASAPVNIEPPAESLPTPPAPPARVAESGVFTTRPSKKQKSKRVVSIESLISPEFRDPPPVAPASTPVTPSIAAVPDPSPVEPSHDETDLDPEAFARATEDFLRNSPVLGLVGKPVVRQKESCDYLDPDAVALSSLAADVSRLGVPEGRRAAARALLLDLAKHLETRDIDWSMLRGTMSFAMEYPDLAKRLMPILLPWFERAA